MEETNIETMSKYEELKLQYKFLTEKCEVLEEEFNKKLEQEKNN